MHEPVPVSFDWGERCRVPVKESIERGGVHAELEYDLVVSPYEPTGGWTVEYTELDVLRVDRRPVPASAQEQVRAAFSLPTIELSPDGLAVGAIGFDQFLDTFIEAMGYSPDSEEATNARSPQFRQFFEESAVAKTWSVWVGGWAGLGWIEPGVTNHVAEQLAADGSTIEIPYTIENLGMYPSGEVWLRYMEVVDSATMGRLLDARLGGLFPDVEDEMTATGALRTIEFTVVTDPATLRPSLAHYEQTIATSTARQREVRFVNFDFAAADGCG